jgi:glycosyltransferase involved in cell wall biosynthesis
MRIAIVLQGGIGGGSYSQGYPPLLSFVLRLSKKFDVTVYSIFPANEDFAPREFRFRSPARRFQNTKVRTLMLIWLLLSDHLKRRFDIVHGFWVYPAGTIVVLMGKLLFVPSIVTVQGGEAAAIPQLNYGNMLRPWLRKITLFTCEKATALNSISIFLIDELKKFGLKRNDSSIIPFGAEASRFRYHEKSITIPLCLLHIANLTEVKDQETIIHALQIIREKIPAHLTIVGSDYLRGKLQKLVAEVGLSDAVSFAAAVHQQELSSFYREAHIMIHPSLHEGQSGVVAEAMASGVVVVGTPVGMMYDLGNAYVRLVPFRNPPAIANAVLELVDNPGMYDELRNKSREHAVAFDAAWTSEEFSRLYSSIKK